MEKKKSVFIPANETVEKYYYEGMDTFDSDWIHESSHRKRMEQSVFRKPYTELGRFQRMVASWRKHDACIVFGNLGRQPYLLNYYLDMCFSYQEEVNLKCRWKFQSHYQVETTVEKDIDFLFVVEPPFGFTIKKSPRVKHLVILTSHLNLFAIDRDRRYYYLHLASKRNHVPPYNDLLEGVEFKPPIFHDETRGSLPDGPIFLDVRNSKTANEAYLRLLTGKEMIGPRPYKILMNNRDREILSSVLSITENKIKKLKFVSWNKKFYCCI